MAWKLVAVTAVAWIAVISTDDEPPVDNGRSVAASPFLRFKARDYVELADSVGLVQPESSFTVEMWVRWSPYEVGEMYLMGDEAWPTMSPDIDVQGASGWVLRTSAIEKGDWRRLNFTIGVKTNRKPDWKQVISTPRRCTEASGWHHVAACKNANNLLLFWNGSLVARESLQESTPVPCATPLYVGVRKSAFENRSFFGDIRSLRISGKARYSKDFVPNDALEKDDVTLCLLDFAHATSEIVKDLSGKNHHGKIVGANLIIPKKGGG